MDKVKWGILSTANIAQTQVIPAIQRSKKAEVIAIASRGEKVHRFANDMNIARAYENYEALLKDEDVQVIYIPLPNDLHKEWVMKAAAAGKHILCEKPISLTNEDLDEMIATCKKHNVLLMEAYMYQFHAQHARVKEIIASGEIGEVKLFKSSHSFDFVDRDGNIRMDPSKGGGALFDVGCYTLHALLTIIGSQPKSVFFQTIMDEKSKVDTTAVGMIQLENQVTALIDCSFDMTNRNEYEIVGTKGAILVKYAFRPDFFSGNGQIIITTGATSRTEQIPGDIYLLEVDYFSDAVLSNASLDDLHENSKQTLRLLNAARQSALENSVIYFD